ncbi:MAG: hybrid sensor histidine kinase/response regulator [Chloroflexi bacterium]|nr:hybrid sensor histidine kinase/response regulator [Chloroflexota bacterium]
MTNTPSPKRGNILIVDDTPANLKILTTMLSSQGYRVRPAINGDVALKAVHSAPPDLILLDIMMPGMSGFDVCLALKANRETQKIPVIFISALDETLDKVKAFQMGGVDYITKPFQTEEVLVRVNTHLALDRQRREIESLNALKDVLIRTVSHDLKNPISNIMGYAELLLAEKGLMQDLEQAERLLRRVHQSAGQMYDLVNSLLEMTRIEDNPEMDMTAVLLRDVLAAQFGEHELQAYKQGITLTGVASEAYPAGMVVWADAVWLGVVFANLLTNAIKYTPSGGTVTMTVERTDTEALVHVRDTGLGIPEADQPYVFDKFFRVNKPSHLAIQGAGLGLAIAQAIVGHHNGRITLESELGRGSCFTVALPLHDLEARN